MGRFLGFSTVLAAGLYGMMLGCIEHLIFCQWPVTI